MLEDTVGKWKVEAEESAASMKSRQTSRKTVLEILETRMVKIPITIITSI
jgi:hypothetical protein